MITYNTIDVPMPDFSHRKISAWVKAEVNRQYLQHD